MRGKSRPGKGCDRRRVFLLHPDLPVKRVDYLEPGPELSYISRGPVWSYITVILAIAVTAKASRRLIPAQPMGPSAGEATKK